MVFKKEGSHSTENKIKRVVSLFFFLFYIIEKITAWQELVSIIHNPFLTLTWESGLINIHDNTPFYVQLRSYRETHLKGNNENFEFVGEETSLLYLDLPPHCISVIRHVETVVHWNPTFTTWIIAPSPRPPGMKTFSRGPTGVLGSSLQMILLMVPNTHHIWQYSGIGLNNCMPLFPNVGLQLYNRESYMGMHRYGISLRVFKSIAHKWDVELNMRREIPYL